MSNDQIHLAVAYSEALDRCTRSGGSNIDEAMDFFAGDAVQVIVGWDPPVGKAAIKDSFPGRS